MGLSRWWSLPFLALTLLFAQPEGQKTVTIATVNNGDMITMQRLSRDFERQHPDIHLDWVVL